MDTIIKSIHAALAKKIETEPLFTFCEHTSQYEVIQTLLSLGCSVYFMVHGQHAKTQIVSIVNGQLVIDYRRMPEISFETGNPDIRFSLPGDDTLKKIEIKVRGEIGTYAGSLGGQPICKDIQRIYDGSADLFICILPQKLFKKIWSNTHLCQGRSQHTKYSPAKLLLRVLWSDEPNCNFTTYKTKQSDYIIITTLRNKHCPTNGVSLPDQQTVDMFE